MTAKQRSKIYRKAAEIVFCGIENSCCWTIQLLVYPDERYLDQMALQRDFKELYLFDPDYGGYWWFEQSQEQNRDARIICLLLCENIVLHP